MDKYRLIFVATYLVIDLIYVTISRNTYNSVVKNIQGAYMPPITGTRIGAVFAAYTCMALGWYFLAANQADAWAKRMPAYQAGALAGLIYGLAVIGTFDFTLHVMLDNYDVNIVMRDLAWGVSWAVISTTLYAVCKDNQLF
jgi:uncharacterized membrane protein